MKITITYQDKPVVCKFVQHRHCVRLWVTDPSAWYPSLGWCPHLNIGGGECRDCSLVLDED